MFIPPPKKFCLSTISQLVLFSLTYANVNSSFAADFIGDSSLSNIVLGGGSYGGIYGQQPAEDTDLVDWSNYSFSFSNTTSAFLHGIDLSGVNHDLSFTENKLILQNVEITAANDATLINAIETKGNVTAKGNVVNYISSSSGNFKAVLLGSNTGDAIAEQNSMFISVGDAGDVSETLPSKFSNLATAEVRSYAGQAIARENTLVIDNLSSANVATAGRSTIYTNGTLALSEKNHLIINGDSYAGQFISGYAWARNTSGDAEASENILEVNTLTNRNLDMLVSGYAQSSQGKSVADGNSLMVSTEISVTNVLGSFAYAISSGETSANNNMVTVSANANIVTLYGARAYSTRGEINGTATANRNKVTVQDGQIGTVYAGQAVSSSVSQASSNELYIYGGQVTDVYGGYATTTSGSTPDSLESSQNKVIIAGGTVAGNVYAGAVADVGEKRQTQNNSIHLYKGADLEQAHLFGGSYEATGNSLLINDFSGEIASISNFESILFTVTDETMELQSPVLTITEGLDSQSVVNVDLLLKSPIGENNKIVLINGDGAESLVAGEIKIVDPIYDFQARFDTDTEDQFSLSIDGKQVNTDTSVLSAGQIASAIDLDRSINLITNYFNNDLNTANGLFVIAGAGKEEFDRWGSLEVDGSNAIVGANGNMDLGDAKLHVSVFLEYGKGDYEAKNKGYAKGDLKHYGLGVYGKIQQSGLYAEASIRAGRAETEFISVLNNVSIGTSDTERAYWSTHVGAGYDLRLTDQYVLTPYAKYFVTYLDSHSEGIENNNIHWDEFLMQKTLLGIGLTAIWSDQISSRLDFGWEKVFDADSEISFGQGGKRVDNYEGDNAYIQASLQYSPTNNLMFGIQAQGRTGDYQGLTGLFNVQYIF